MKIVAYKSIYNGQIFERRSDLSIHYAEVRAQKAKEKNIKQLVENVKVFSTQPAASARSFEEFFSLTKKSLNKMLALSYVTNNGELFVIKPEGQETFTNLKITNLTFKRAKYIPHEENTIAEMKKRWAVEFEVEFNKEISHICKISILRYINGLFALTAESAILTGTEILFLEKGLHKISILEKKSGVIERKVSNHYTRFNFYDKGLKTLLDEISAKELEIKNLTESVNVLNASVVQKQADAYKEALEKVPNPYTDQITAAKKALNML